MFRDQNGFTSPRGDLLNWTSLGDYLIVEENVLFQFIFIAASIKET